MTCKCYHADKNFLGEIGACWGTKEREPCSCRGDEAKCDFYDYVRERVKKPITNADKYFRNATDDMIAEWIAKHMYCAECMFFNDDNGTCKYEQRYRKGCNGAMLDWLKQEVEGDA